METSKAKLLYYQSCKSELRIEAEKYHSESILEEAMGLAQVPRNLQYQSHSLENLINPD